MKRVTPNTWEPMIWRRTTERLEREGYRCGQPIAVAIVLVIGAVLAWLVWP